MLISILFIIIFTNPLNKYLSICDIIKLILVSLVSLFIITALGFIMMYNYLANFEENKIPTLNNIANDDLNHIILAGCLMHFLFYIIFNV